MLHIKADDQDFLLKFIDTNILQSGKKSKGFKEISMRRLPHHDYNVTRFLSSVCKITYD